MQRTLKYRLYPNRKQRDVLAAQLGMCRELYNAALQERIESYKTTGKGVTWLQQGTSQTCVCGASVPKRLSDREHVCTACGLIADRVVAAQVILQRAGTQPLDANVSEVTLCVV